MLRCRYPPDSVGASCRRSQWAGPLEIWGFIAGGGGEAVDDMGKSGLRIFLRPLSALSHAHAQKKKMEPVGAQ